MPEQLGLSPERYWYSLITAAPAPELPDRASVGMIFGNGRAFLLRYKDMLPRLCGLAAIDEVRVYQAVLESLAERIGRSHLDLATVRGMIGPQLLIEEPRTLWREFSEELVERLVDRYLSAPDGPPNADPLAAVLRHSMQGLDKYLRQARVPESLVVRTARLEKLYPELRQPLRRNAPPLARAVRGFGRDLLLDGLRFSDEYRPQSIRNASMRIGEAFYAYDHELRHAIKVELNRDIRVVGILQPTPKSASADLRHTRAFVADMWTKQHAVVIDADREDVEEALRREHDWLTKG